MKCFSQKAHIKEKSVSYYFRMEEVYNLQSILHILMPKERVASPWISSLYFVEYISKCLIRTFVQVKLVFGELPAQRQFVQTLKEKYPPKVLILIYRIEAFKGFSGELHKKSRLYDMVLLQGSHRTLHINDWVIMTSVFANNCLSHWGL